MSLGVIDLLLYTTWFAGKRIEGRTKLQKLVYFACRKLGLNLDFIPHFYGPYSRKVSAILSDLISADLVEEKSILVSGDRQMYVYVLPENMEEVLGDDLKKYENTLGELIKMLLANSRGDLNILATMAKVDYIISHSLNYNIQDNHKIIEEGRKLGWILSEEEVNNAIITLRQLGLIRNEKDPS